MKAEEVYSSLDNEFEIDKIEEEEWGLFDLDDFVTESFRNTKKGLVLDFAKEIETVYTAVFPSESVLDQILDLDVTDALLFTHHPMIWETGSEGYPFRNIPREYLEKLKNRRISYYAIHLPLDRVGPYSTGMSMARAFQVEPIGEFAEFNGINVGVLGKTDCKTINELAARVEDTVEHKVKLWDYGSHEIPDQNVAIVGGGGNYPQIAEELGELGIRTYITGVTMKVPNYKPSLIFHEICKKYGINVIAATHYSTEKFACIDIVDFFSSIGIQARLIDDEPQLTDLE